MILTEDQLVEFLTGLGFDFTSTVRQISQRFPIELSHGNPGFRVVPYQLRTPLVGGLVWKIPVDREEHFELPPLRYLEEFHPTSDARQNHDQAEAKLVALLGEGEKGISTNVYERHWKVGIFGIRVLTWPRELNLRSNNTFQGRNPNLWISANIYVEPEIPFIAKTEDTALPIQVLLKGGPGVTLECSSQVYTRRNRMDAFGPPIAGLAADGAFVIRTFDRSVRVPSAEIRSVELTRLLEGRSPGGSRLDLKTLFLNRHELNVSVARGPEIDSLESAAKVLAKGLGKPLKVHEYSTD